jgi:hypothetical protein
MYNLTILLIITELTFTFKQYFYSDMPTCKPILYLHIDSKVNLTCSFYNYKFSVAQKILCTPWQRNTLTSSKLCASAASGLGDNFSLGTLKNDFAALIYKQLSYDQKVFGSGLPWN